MKLAGHVLRLRAGGSRLPRRGKRGIGEEARLSGLPHGGQEDGGPSYKDVAAKYRADKEAPKKLAAKVKNGSQGVWGTYRCRRTPRCPTPT